jgi:hypothetical protein
MLSGRREAACRRLQKMERKQHWERAYETTDATAVSWFQPEPTLSLRLLEAGGLRAGT